MPGIIKAVKAIKNAASKVGTKAKGYGDKGQYSRLDDMKKSEFYRDRHNAGKSYSSDKSSANTLKAMGAAGTGMGAILYSQTKEENAKKVAQNKLKVQQNAQKVQANAQKLKKSKKGGAVKKIMLKSKKK
jgi:hypothetical protein